MSKKKGLTQEKASTVNIPSRTTSGHKKPRLVFWRTKGSCSGSAATDCDFYKVIANEPQEKKGPEKEEASYQEGTLVTQGSR